MSSQTKQRKITNLILPQPTELETVVNCILNKTFANKMYKCLT